jgi:hypothetical protein
LGFDILAKVFTIVKQKHLGDGGNIISGVFPGGAGGVPIWSMFDQVSATTTLKALRSPGIGIKTPPEMAQDQRSWSGSCPGMPLADTFAPSGGQGQVNLSGSSPLIQSFSIRSMR